MLVRRFLARMAGRYLTRLKVKYILACVILVITLDYFGAFTHFFETSFEKFTYPFEGDVHMYVEQLKNKDTPDIPPINIYNYTFISTCNKKCAISDGSDKLRLVYIVKSDVKHFERRIAIRNSWGFEKRFSDVPIRTVFVLGIHDQDVKLQNKVMEEQTKYADIVQADFHDSYFNNTIKTMIGFKWAVTYCPNSRFYMFSDDDMYISTKNVLRFVRNPTHYPEYLETPVISLRRRELFGYKFEMDTVTAPGQSLGKMNIPRRGLNQVFDFELDDDVKLYAGYVFVSSPHRHRSSKWYVPLSEYPYHLWPPYVTAGAYILSNQALVDMYYTSLYTKHFRFDDIYLGLVAKKADIEPFHCEEFHFYKKEYNIYSYHYVVASHGYGDPGELLRVWNEQKSIGNA